MHSNDVVMENISVTSYEQSMVQASRIIDQPSAQTTTSQNHKPCNCRKSRCLKLYCECFANNRFCGPQCACCSCNNAVSYDSVRLQAKQQILMRNPHAFRRSKVVETEQMKILA